MKTKKKGSTPSQQVSNSFSQQKSKPNKRKSKTAYKKKKEKRLALKTGSKEDTELREAIPSIPATPASSDSDKEFEETNDGYLELGAPIVERDKTPAKRAANGEKPQTESPWVPHDKIYSSFNSFIQLHEEILDFCDFISPTEEEKRNRIELVDRLEKMVKGLWPNSNLLIHGSQATDLFLPLSDIDIIIDIPENRDGSVVPQLRLFAQTIERADLAEYLEVIDKARVPIIKFTHRVTGLNVDICIGVDSGLRTANLTRSYMLKFPALRPLTLVIKYFLNQRGLNETYSGGVGSFLLQLMIISFLQHTQRRTFHLPKPERPPLNLGLLLLEFLGLYGVEMNYITTGISVRKGGTYYSKLDGDKMNFNRPFLLSIENPDDTSIDVGANSFEIRQVKRVFEYAYHRLRAQVAKVNESRPKSQRRPRCYTLLQNIIHADEFLQEREKHKGKSFGFQMLGHSPETTQADGKKNREAHTQISERKRYRNDLDQPLSERRTPKQSRRH